MSVQEYLHPQKNICRLVNSSTFFQIVEGGSSCFVIFSTTVLATFGTYPERQGSCKPICGRDDGT